MALVLSETSRAVNNGMLHARPGERPLISNDVSAHAMTWAQERVLGNLDVFGDTLNNACFGRRDVDSDWATRVPGQLEHADDAVVLHAALVAANRDDAATTLEAMRLLAQRHLDRNAARVAELAGAAS